MSSEINTSVTPQESTDIMGMKPNTYCMLLHLSQLLNFCAPPCGIVIPIVLWALGKDKSTEVDLHGKIALNWIISCFIYGLVIGLSLFILIGFFLAPVLVVLMIVFPVVAAVKANDGIVWKYPLSIPFFR